MARWQGELKHMEAKMVALVVTMAVLGNVLSLIPIGLTRVGQVGFDLSLIPVFVVALYGGPILGFLTGLAAGVSAGIMFGPMGWLSWLGLIGLPIGKALTGLAAGALFRGIKVRKKAHQSLLTVPLVLVAYVPEFLFTVIFFLALTPYFLGPPWTSFSFSMSILAPIAIKAWIELGIMSFLMGALVGNAGFSNFMWLFFDSHKRAVPDKKLPF